MQLQIKPKLTFISTKWVKCGFNLRHNRFCSISGMVRTDWTPLSQEVFKAKCKENIILSKLYETLEK